MNLDLLKTLTRWTDRTDFILRRSQQMLSVKKTGELDRSQQYKVHQVSEALLESEMSFLVRGRFVDMGAGRASTKIETLEGNRQLLEAKKTKARVPKKWYARVYWGRLNDLQGVIGYRIMESAVRSIKDNLDDANT
jgi:hypothetical protein